MSLNSFTSSRGYQYSYLLAPPTGDHVTNYIFFLHGFPSLAREWYSQIDHFSRLGYGIITPDLLGYGKTACPLELTAYTMKGMSMDLKELLDHERVDRVYGVGHDTGSHLLSRLAIYYPKMVAKIGFLTVGYTGVGETFNVDFINKMTAEHLGYSAYGYIKFFDSGIAARMMARHSDSFQSLVYAADPELWKVHWGPIGALEEWLNTDCCTEVGSWYRQQDRLSHSKSFAQTGFEPCLNWYLALTHNINLADEQALSKDSVLLAQPVLFLGSGKDPIAIPSVQLQMMQDKVENMKVETIDSGHWIHLEKSVAVNNLLESFFADDGKTQTKKI